jgi:hypothetical protein
MPFTPTSWERYPSTKTPVTKEALDHLGTQYAEAVKDAKEYTDQKGGGISEVTYALLPAGTTLTVTKTGTTWPPRPTSRTDIVVRWKGADPAPGFGGLAMVEGVDVRDIPVTKEALGLTNVDNTSDMNKPVSTAQRAAIDGSVSGTAEVPLQRVINQRADGTYPDRPDRSTKYTVDWRGNPAAPVSATKALAGVDTILLTDTVAS